MAKLYLVRHGETEWNVLRRVQGSMDAPLTENGIQQAKNVAKRLAKVDFAAAFAYHPLFWVVPIAFVLAFVREEVASSKLKRGIDIAVTVLCVLVVVVWIVRLINPADAGLLFGGYAPAGVPDDIIHLEPPRWLTILRSYLA